MACVDVQLVQWSIGVRVEENTFWLKKDSMCAIFFLLLLLCAYLHCLISDKIVINVIAWRGTEIGYG